MDMAKMCSYTPPQQTFLDCKCMLHCCYNYPCIALSYQYPDRLHFNVYPSIYFHIYHLISLCKVHGRLPLDED